MRALCVLTLQVQIKLPKQRVDRHFLNAVRRIPRKPLVAVVLGEDDVNGPNDAAKIDQDLFFNKAPAAVALLTDWIAVFEAKRWIDLDVGCSNAGFFFELPQCTLQLRFAFVNMPLRQIPAMRISSIAS